MISLIEAATFLSPDISTIKQFCSNTGLLSNLLTQINSPSV